MRSLIFAAALAIGLSVSVAHAETDAEVWADLVVNVFDGRPIEDGSGVLALEAPYRAEDAAIVPVTIRSALPDGSKLGIRKITLVIDRNPAPVAAEFSFGARPVSAISTRVRVNTYTNVRAVAEASDGKLYGVSSFVKASGGCSAPASKGAEATAGRGEMRLRWFEGEPPRDDGTREAQLMIRHPNNSGLQMDQVTRNYIPAFFVRDVTVTAGGEMLFRMEGGISISENPSFRFTYEGAAGDAVAAEAVDTDGNRFHETWPGAAAGAS